jgi:uncharacterized protein YceH (UPF0502 family)
MLRGPQTAAELRTRTERLHPFASVPEVEEGLHTLAERELVARLARRPGEREERWTQLLGEGGDAEPAQPATTSSSLEERVARLEERLARLEERLGD